MKQESCYNASTGCELKSTKEALSNKWLSITDALKETVGYNACISEQRTMGIIVIMRHNLLECYSLRVGELNTSAGEERTQQPLFNWLLALWSAKSPKVGRRYCLFCCRLIARDCPFGEKCLAEMGGSGPGLRKMNFWWSTLVACSKYEI